MCREITKRVNITELIPDNSIGAELGVAHGWFSNQLLNSKKIKHLYSIDMWSGDRGHDVEEYKDTIRRLQKHYDKNSIIRAKFVEAINLFDDNYFDLIYIDGYAHTGQDGGETLRSWWSKVKTGGVFGGHDYDKMFPIMIETVNRFVEELGYTEKLNIIKEKPYNSWYIIK
jgi:hypothetical protein